MERMSKRFFFGALFVIGLTILPSVFAQEATSPGRRSLPIAPRVREEIRTNARERWQEIQEDRKAKREEIKENVQVKRAEMKANIKNFRDERKKLVVENVQKKLADLNERRTDHFTKVLERLTTILDKIQSRTEKAKAEGKNVSSIEEATAAARTAIAAAESAVNAQKQKTYQITVNDENTAKVEVGATVKQMHADLQAVHDTVKAARQAVEKVFEQIKSVIGTSSTTTPTP